MFKDHISTVALSKKEIDKEKLESFLMDLKKNKYKTIFTDPKSLLSSSGRYLMKKKYIQSHVVPFVLMKFIVIICGKT